MELQLFRIDDRLIHGQVVIGWAQHLNSDTIVLGDDSVADNEWEKELYLSIVPDRIQAFVLKIDQLAQEMKNDNNNWGKTIILVNSPFSVEKLLAQDVLVREVNVGGIHFKDGRKELLPYLFLNEEEINSFRRLMDRGITFFCQDVPTAKPVPLQNLINK